MIATVALVLFIRHLPGWDWADPSGIPADFRVYLHAIERYRSGLSPYDVADLMTYKYAPGLFPLFWLGLGWAPNAAIAWLTFKALSLSCWAAGAWRSIPSTSWRDLGLLFVGLLFTWKSLLEALDFGQLEVLAFLLLSLSFSTGRLAATAAALFPFLKLPWGVFSLGWSIRTRAKYWRTASLVVFLFGVGAPLLMFGGRGGLQSYSDWWHVLNAQPASILVKEVANQSLSALFGRLFGSPWVGLLNAALVLVVTARISWKRRGEEGSLTPLTRWAVAALLANPLSWRWGGLLLLATPWVVADRWQRLETRGLTAALIAHWLFQQTPVVRAFGWNHWTDLHPYGFITLGWLLVWGLCLLPAPRKTSWNANLPERLAVAR